MPSLKAIFFDLDGTLIDSLDDLAFSVNLMLVEHGYPTRDHSVFPKYIGDGVRELITRALPEHARQDESITRCLQNYQKHYAEHWHDETVPYPGILELLVELKERGLALGCISNKPHHFTTLCCDHFFPAHTFEVVFGQRDSVPRKPSPEAAFEAAALVGVKIEECAYLGDSGIDMQFAKQAGMMAIGVSWGFRSVEELKRAGAQHILHSAQELLPLLQE